MGTPEKQKECHRKTRNLDPETRNDTSRCSRGGNNPIQIMEKIFGEEQKRDEGGNKGKDE